MNKLLILCNPFRKPTAKEIAARDLEDARREWLKSKSASEYHAKMAEYYAGVMGRLSNYLKED